MASKITHLQNTARDAVSPIQKSIQSLVNPISNSIIGASNYNQIASQNKTLREQIKALQKELNTNIDSIARLKELTALENLPYEANIPTVIAQVINNSMSNYSDTIELDKGTSSGVGVGMTVVTPEGLVGKIISAGSSTCVVLLITDPTNTISVSLYFNSGKAVNAPGQNSANNSAATTTTTISTTSTSTSTTTVSGSTSTSTQGAPAQNNISQVFALANGQSGSNKLSLSFVPPTVSPTNNQVIYTASLNGGDYPPGIPVGYVSDVTIKPGNLQGSVEVAPMVNFSNLYYVDVLQWLPSP